MPDQEGRLTNQDRRKIIEFLNPKAKDHLHHCPFCDSTEWIPGAHVVFDTVGTPDPKTDEFPVVPYVVYFCKNCAYTIKFNAIMMGLYESGVFIPAPTYPVGATQGVRLGQ